LHIILVFGWLQWWLEEKKIMWMIAGVLKKE